VRKRLTTALVFALTVNIAIMAAASQSEDQRSTEKGDQSKWAQYSPRAGGSTNSKGDCGDLDSSAVHTEAGMNPTIVIFLGLSVLLVVVVGAVAASRADFAKRHRKIRT
jgi:hypothetical protein